MLITVFSEQKGISNKGVLANVITQEVIHTVLSKKEGYLKQKKGFLSQQHGDKLFRTQSLDLSVSSIEEVKRANASVGLSNNITAID